MRHLINFICFSLISLIGLTSCAAGSATAAYAIQARTAENLTGATEERIVQRVRHKVLQDLGCAPHLNSCPCSQPESYPVPEDSRCCQ